MPTKGINQLTDCVKTIGKILAGQCYKYQTNSIEDPCITYTQLADEYYKEADKKILPHYLAGPLYRLSTFCMDIGKNLPPLSVLVVRQKARRPGPGFFDMLSARSETYYNKFDSEEDCFSKHFKDIKSKIKNDSDSFWKQLLQNLSPPK